MGRSKTPIDGTHKGPAVIKYRCPNGRIFARVFSENSIDECRAIILEKLGLPQGTKLHLSQLQDGERIDLEDDEDFRALRESSYLLHFLEVDVLFDDASIDTGLDANPGNLADAERKVSKQTAPMDSVDTLQRASPYPPQAQSSVPTGEDQQLPESSTRDIEMADSVAGEAGSATTDMSSTLPVRRKKKLEREVVNPPMQSTEEAGPASLLRKSRKRKARGLTFSVTETPGPYPVSGVVQEGTPGSIDLGQRSEDAEANRPVEPSLPCITGKKRAKGRTPSPEVVDPDLISKILGFSNIHCTLPQPEPRAQDPAADLVAKRASRKKRTSASATPLEQAFQANVSASEASQQPNTRKTRKKCKRRNYDPSVGRDDAATKPMKKQKKMHSSVPGDINGGSVMFGHLGDEEAAVTNHSLMRSSTGATPSISLEMPSPTGPVKTSPRKSDLKVSKDSKLNVDNSSATTSRLCNICQISIHDLDQCTLLKEGNIDGLRTRLSELEQIEQSLADNDSETSIAALMAAIISREAAQENRETPPPTPRKVSACSYHGNSQTPDIPTTTGTDSTGETMENHEVVINQATHISSSLKPSSECDTVPENVSESSPQPGQAAARVLVVDSSQECKVSPRNHRVLSQHPCQEAEPSLTGLGQMPESPVTEYFGNRAFSEALSEDNRFEKRMMAGPGAPGSNIESDEAANEEGGFAERRLYHPNTPERNLRPSRPSAQLGVTLPSASQRQRCTPLVKSKRGGVLVPSSQPLPILTSGPILEDEFVEMETLPAVGENMTDSADGYTLSSECHRASLHQTQMGQETPQNENMNESTSAMVGSTLSASLYTRSAGGTMSNEVGTPLKRSMRRGIVLSQEGGNSQRNGTLTVDELESVSDGNATRSSAQRVGVPRLDDYTFQANADLEKGKHTNSQDGTVSDSAESTHPSVSGPSGKPRRSSSYDEASLVDSSLDVNRVPGSPFADDSIAGHHSPVTQCTPREADNREPALFLSSPRTQQSTTGPSSADRLPPRMRSGIASQQPASFRWPSLMSLTTDQVRDAAQSRRSISISATNPRSLESPYFGSPFNANDDEDAEESSDEDSDDMKIVSSQIPPGRRAGSNLGHIGLMERTAKFLGKSPRTLFST